ELLFVETKKLRALRGGDRRRARFAGEDAHLAEEIAFAELGEIDAAALRAARVDLHFARDDEIHRRSDIAFADDHAAFVVRFQIHLAHERRALFVGEHFKQRALRHGTREHRLALPGGVFFRRGRGELIARLIRFLADGDGLHGEAVVFVVLRRRFVLRDCVLGHAGAGERVRVLQSNARIRWIFFLFALEEWNGASVFTAGEETRAAFSFFSHASVSYPLELLLRGGGGAGVGIAADDFVERLLGHAEVAGFLEGEGDLEERVRRFVL